MENSDDFLGNIAAGRNDAEELRERLSKMRNFVQEDHSEVGLLRSRVDEQSHLIMVLKKRADEHLIRAQTLERLNQGLTEESERVTDQLQRVKQTNTSLEKRLNELSTNHEQMIRYKDVYKRDSERLQVENEELKSRLARQMARQVKERDDSMLQLTERSRVLEESNRKLENSLADSENQRRSIERSHEAQLLAVREELKESQARLKGFEREREKVWSVKEKEANDVQQRLQKTLKEKDEFFQLAMDRGRIVQEKQSEIQTLQTRLTEAEERSKRIQSNYQNELESVNSNVQVRHLRQQVTEQENKLRELNREFQAYKVHATALLQSEKEVNARLRNLYS